MVDREDLLLWPTYKILRLDAWHDGRWSFVLSFLGFQAFVWFLIVSTAGVGFRWV
jgi:hypothetical protein